MTWEEEPAQPQAVDAMAVTGCVRVDVALPRQNAAPVTYHTVRLPVLHPGFRSETADAEGGDAAGRAAGRAGRPLMTGLLCLGLPGKVAIQKEDLQRYHNRDTWFQLQHVDADSEVQVRLREPTGPGASGRRRPDCGLTAAAFWSSAGRAAGCPRVCPPGWLVLFIPSVAVRLSCAA